MGKCFSDFGKGLSDTVKDSGGLFDDIFNKLWEDLKGIRRGFWSVQIRLRDTDKQ